jgi:Tfp pilus assembly protein PilN
VSARFHLDFVRSRRPAGVAGVILLIVGIVAFSGILGMDLLSLRPTLASIQAQVDASQQALEARHPKLAKAELVRFENDRQEVAKASATINRPWMTLFDKLESLADRQVALLTLEPDPAKGEISLVAEARDLDAMSAYYREIQSLDGFSDVALRNHQTNFQDPDKPVRFRLTLKWNFQS